MSRAATTSDVFNAIAEPRRRQILDLLAGGRAWPVGEVVQSLGLPQPAVSKHLGVLRKVGLVSVRKEGKLRLYELKAQDLKAVHDWVKAYERFWTHHVDRIKERAERKALERAAGQSKSTNPEK